jgi:pyruvate dehydrogenase phosphatase regulatory subunit
MYTVLSIAGPKSKELMDEMTGTDMAMHPFTYREVNVGYASGVMVLAVTNTGETRSGSSLFFCDLSHFPTI